MFCVGQIVVHRKTGGRYRIVIGATDCRLEANGQAAYAYQRDAADSPGHGGGHRPAATDTTIWVRAAEEMEDGRFVSLD
jgi:uncharacterized protein YdeI (BOF family)